MQIRRPQKLEPTPMYTGRGTRLCQDHKSHSNTQAWCYTCSEWCYDHDEKLCKGCLIPLLIQKVNNLENELENTLNLEKTRV